MITTTNFSGGVTPVGYSQSLQSTSNYLYYLCGKYALMALAIINGGGGVVGTVVQPNAPYLIPITGADFATATEYNNPAIVGRNLAIFWNDVPRYLFPNEFEYTTTGINITIPGFDATANPGYQLFIYIIN